MSNEQKVSSELVQVYVGNIKYETTEKELYDLAKKYVDVESTKIPTKLGRSQGFGFVTVYNEESLEKLKKELDGTTFQGRTIYIKNAVHGQNKKEEKDEYVRRMPPPQPMMAPMREYNYPDPVYRDERDYFYNDYYYDNIPRERRRGIPPPPPPPPMPMHPRMRDPYEEDFYQERPRYREDYFRGKQFYDQRYRDNGDRRYRGQPMHQGVPPKQME